MATLKIEESLAGKRLDEALASLPLYPSRSLAQKAIRQGRVLVNGKPEKAHYALRLGDVVEYEPAAAEKSDLRPEDIPLDIVYEDEDLLVVNKPQGMVVHPGNGHAGGTLINALLARGIRLAPGDDPARPGLVHRIDKDTSGLLVVAKNDDALRFLQAQLKGHAMHREYKALVHGIIREDEGKIDAPLARDRKDPVKMAVDPEYGKEAVTFFHVERRYWESNCTLIDCRLLTGRTHQIRVHLDYIGHPVEGDPVYGEGNRKIYQKGQLLHAYRISFVHPRSKQEVSFEAPLPDYFEEVLKNLK